jgi:predicted CopG family antitoxin
MVVKTITVTEDAYEAMKRLKREYESFSDLFLRISGKPITIKDIAGILKHTPEETEEFRRRVLDVHKRLGEGMRRRIENVRARLERAHRSDR